MIAKPQTVTLETQVQCYGCGWKDMLGNSKISMWLDHRPDMLIPINQGGNGKNYRCPECQDLIFYTRNEPGKKDIAPSGHQFKHIT